VHRGKQRNQKLACRRRIASTGKEGKRQGTIAWEEFPHGNCLGIVGREMKCP
jgi:hypothetical protein